MAKAVWNDIVIAESDDFIVIEGNKYFPPESVKKEYLRPSSTTTICPWKGEAHYYDVVIGDQVNKDAVWYYPHPKEAANQIKNYIAFWQGVEVTD